MGVRVPVMMRMRMVRMVVYTLARAMRIVAEHQRFDRDRNGVGREADTPEIDIVEIHQHHAVDAENLALHPAVFPQDRAQRLRDIAVEHEINRLFGGEFVRKPFCEPAGAGMQPVIGGSATPAECKGNFGLRPFGVECLAMRPDRIGQRRGINEVGKSEARLQHLQIAPGQQETRIGNVAGVSRKLHAVFRGAKRGSPYALACRQ